MQAMKKQGTNSGKAFLLIGTIMVIHIVGIAIVYKKTKPPNIDKLIKQPLEAHLTIVPETIPLTLSIAGYPNIPTAKLIISVKNNFGRRVSRTRLVVPNVGLKTLETPGALRTDKPWKNPDDIYLIDGTNTDETKTATISAYAMRSGTYSFRVWVLTEEGLTTTTNQATLVVN